MADSAPTGKAAENPDSLRYHESHVWARLEDGVASFGITRHAQRALGDIVYFAPPEPGSTIHAGDGCGELESVKAVSDLVAPVGGHVLEVNERVVESPESLNADPYGCWLVRLRIDDPAMFDGLLTAEQYEALL